MASKVKILNTNLNLSMKTSASNTQIKKIFLEVYEKQLKEKYNPPTILPIPDNIPENIPLIVMHSLSNHTQLVLTRNSISIGTSYDDLFNSSWDKCENHLKEKVQDVFLFINALESIKINYIGLVAQIIMEEYDDASKYIFDNLLKFNSDKNIYDSECKLTYLLKQQYYINLDIQNIRLYNGEPILNDSQIPPIEQYTNSQNKLLISLDINNRYCYNFDISNDNVEQNNVDEIVLYARKMVVQLEDIVKGDVKIEI